MFTHSQACADPEHFSKVVCVCGEFRSIFSVIFAKFEFSREGPDALPSLPKVKKIRACTVINLWVDSGNILSIRSNQKLSTAQTGSLKRELG